jgi:hypothetical protein
MLILSATPAIAMPPPFLESADDVIAIVYSREVMEKLGNSNEIKAIIRKGDNQFEISTEFCTLQVQVIHYVDPNEPTPMVPKRNIDLGNLKCVK